MILLVALVLDLAVGDPPNRWHPVRWVGRGLDLAFRATPRRGRLAPLLYGMLVVLAGAGAVAALIARLSMVLSGAGWLGVLIEAWLLKCSFSLRGLMSRARGVERALACADLARARAEVGYHLVSRPTDGLRGEGVASAAVESVAENLTDSFVAPIAFYLAFGLPGAWAYRVVNTADAMVGYRGGLLEYLGKAAARLDDLLNLVPARVAAIALVAGAGLAGADARGAARILRRDRGRTASPNAGWPMAAMAGALGLVLEKAGIYRLGEGRPPDGGDIGRSLRVLAAAAALVGALGVVADLVASRQ